MAVNPSLSAMLGPTKELVGRLLSRPCQLGKLQGRPMGRWQTDWYHGSTASVCRCPKVNEEMMREHFSCSSPITAVGTIGRPGIIAKDDLSWRTATEVGDSIILPPHKVILCPGGVGQPRDRDPRAIYAIMAGPKVTWHRVTDDIEQSIARVKNQGIDARNGERLRFGA
jgi:hypothetical protein